jgi:hypothetical protein
MTSKNKKNGRPFRVGDRVQLPFGLKHAFGTIVEDRGCIGVGGRRLLRVIVDFDESTFFTEVPEADLTLVK